MNIGGFSWKRLVGISAAKSKVSRAMGVPLTRSGRQRKVGRAVGCFTVAFICLIVMVGGFLLFAGAA